MKKDTFRDIFQAFNSQKSGVNRPENKTFYSANLSCLALRYSLVSRCSLHPVVASLFVALCTQHMQDVQGGLVPNKSNFD
jgi:hypothetical protein